jgi:hypothetical protein
MLKFELVLDFFYQDLNFWYSSCHEKPKLLEISFQVETREIDLTGFEPELQLLESRLAHK